MFVYIAVAPYVKTPVIQLNNPFIHDPGGPPKKVWYDLRWYNSPPNSVYMIYIIQVGLIRKWD